ncbi:MAG: hypothetical protein WBW61_06235 [Rhodanobacteraceae bacterium]
MMNLNHNGNSAPRSNGKAQPQSVSADATATRQADEHELVDAIDAAAEEAYWNKYYASRPYIKEGAVFDFYRPAYRYGWESRATYVDKSWDEVRDVLQEDWSADPANFEMSWEDAEPAARDAWERINAAYPDRFKAR